MWALRTYDHLLRNISPMLNSLDSLITLTALSFPVKKEFFSNPAKPLLKTLNSGRFFQLLKFSSLNSLDPVIQYSVTQYHLLLLGSIKAPSNLAA